MASTRDPMPNRVFRLDTETWDLYAEACDEKGLSRSDDLRVYIRREVAAYKRRQRDQQS